MMISPYKTVVKGE